MISLCEQNEIWSGLPIWAPTPALLLSHTFQSELMVNQMESTKQLCLSGDNPWLADRREMSAMLRAALVQLLAHLSYVKLY